MGLAGNSTAGRRIAMGLFGKRRNDGVRGTARVVSSSQPPHATHGSLRMTIVVEAPGIPAYSHDFSKFAVRVDKWPAPGEVLPVEVDPEDPTRVEVLWDEVPTVGDSARQDAEQLAAQLRGQPAGTPPGFPPEAGGIVDQLQQMFPGAVINFGSDQPVAPPPPPPAAPPPPAGPPPVQVVASQSDGDPVERLEKLARLRDAGVVDQAQFEQLRAQILGQAGLDS